MSKITADHLARSAYVYVRQSTPAKFIATTRVGDVSTALPSALNN
jgi:hypothetical protein